MINTVFLIMAVRRQILAAIAGSGTVVLAGCNSTRGQDTGETKSDDGSSYSGNKQEADGSGGANNKEDGYVARFTKLAETEAFLIGVEDLSKDKLVITVDIAEADTIDAVIARSEQKQLHSERIDSVGEYRISLVKDYTTPAKLTIRARGDDSIVGTYKLHTTGPSDR